MTRWSHPALVESRDSPYARITATRAGSQRALFLDDVLVYESESATQEELAHVAALAHPAPRRVLVLGGSVSGIDRELAKHAPERMVVVEMDRTYVEVGRRLARAPDVVVADPRRFLKSSRGDSSNTAVSAPFNLVVIAMPQPTSGQANRFYTREFFEECRQRPGARRRRGAAPRSAGERDLAAARDADGERGRRPAGGVPVHPGAARHVGHRARIDGAAAGRRRTARRALARARADCEARESGLPPLPVGERPPGRTGGPAAPRRGAFEHRRTAGVLPGRGGELAGHVLPDAAGARAIGATGFRSLGLAGSRPSPS